MNFMRKIMDALRARRWSSDAKLAVTSNKESNGKKTKGPERKTRSAYPDDGAARYVLANYGRSVSSRLDARQYYSRCIPVAQDAAVKTNQRPRSKIKKDYVIADLLTALDAVNERKRSGHKV